MIQKLYDIYRHARPKLPKVALFACIGYPLYYSVWAWLFPQPYENLWLRLFCAFLCLPFLVTHKLNRFFLWYFYVTLIILIPFFFSYMLLRNDCSPIWLMSVLCAIFMLFLVISDGLVTCLMTSIGFAAACLILLFTGRTDLLKGFEWSYLPIFVFMFVNGYFLSENLVAQEKSLKQEAGTDCLTGLHNRHYMEKALRREIARARRALTPLGIMMLDIDHFKRINDQYGHLIGDCILKGMGEQLVGLVRDEDIACRYGGEEFLLILPGTDGEQLQQRAEQIRGQLAETLVTLLEYPQNQSRITVSIGLSLLQHPETGVNELIQNADIALYRAKESGRNRVEKGWDCEESISQIPSALVCKPDVRGKHSFV